MKKNTIFKLFASMFLLALVGLAVFGGLYATTAIIGLLTGGGLVGMADVSAGTFTTDTATTETLDSASSELRRPTISKVITQMKPSIYMLDTILREVGLQQTAKSWEYQWYNIDMRGIEDTVKTTLAASAGSSAVNTTYDLIVNNVQNWAVDDNVMVKAINGSDSMPLVLHVVSKDVSANKLVVVPLNGIGDNGYDVPQIVATKELVCIGNAKAELDIQTTPYAAYPQKSENYSQIHMAQIEESFYEKISEKEVNWDINDFRLQSIYDFRRKAELTSLFGVKKKQYDPVGEDYKYFSAGITRMITKSLEYDNTSIDNSTFAGWGRQIFLGNSGSDKRVCFVGGTLKQYLLGIPTIQKQIDAGNTEVKWGITFNKIDTGFGELLVKTHTLFDNVGWTKKGLVLDVNYLEKVILKPMETTKLKLKESGQKNADAEVLHEAFCVATRYPELHAIIEPSS